MWERNGVPLAGLEIRGQGLGGEMVANRLREYDAQVFIQRDEVAVECSVLGFGQAKPVARVQPLGVIRRPGNDVAGGEQRGKGGSRDAAPMVVADEHGAPEKILAESTSNHVLQFRRALAQRPSVLAAGGWRFFN